MLNNKSLMLTIYVFLLWILVGAAGSWLIRLMIDVVQPPSLGVIVALISWIELGIKLIGTYFIARYFLQPSTEKNKHVAQDETPDDDLFHHLEEEQPSAKPLSRAKATQNPD